MLTNDDNNIYDYMVVHCSKVKYFKYLHHRTQIQRIFRETLYFMAMNFVFSS